MVYYVCDGYPDFLMEPAEPEVYVEGFFPWKVLSFNDIEDAMKAEWPAILHWMLQGFKLWKAEGLKKELPAAIARATDDYMEAEDTVGEWIESSADRSDQSF